MDILVQWIDTPRFANSDPPPAGIIRTILDVARKDNIRSHTVRESWSGNRYYEICNNATDVPSNSPKDEFWDIDVWFEYCACEYYIRINYSKPYPDYCFIYARKIVRDGARKPSDGGAMVSLTEIKQDPEYGPILRALTEPAER